MPLSPLELQTILPVAGIDRRDRARLATRSHLMDYRAGDRLYRAGEPCPNIGIVRAGFVWLFRVDRDGKEVTTGIVGPGGLLSVDPLLGRAIHGSEAEALNRVQIMEIPVESITALGTQDTAFMASLVDALHGRIANSYADIAARAGISLPRRVLYVLRLLAPPSIGYGPPEPMRSLPLRISHDQLSRVIGSDRTAITRALRALEDSGQIQREHGRITHVQRATGETRISA